MTPDKWEKIKDLFLAAENISLKKREEFLAKECGDDLEVRQEVEKLLDSYKDDSFLEDTAIAEAPGLFDEKTDNKAVETQEQIHTTSSENGRLLEGSILADRYQILNLLGKGGMGEVYLAQDSELHRQVALKILPTNFTGDNERMRRFAQEARAISALNHPNILTIYEIGKTDGVHFIATEYIEGKTLKEHLRDNNLNLETAIEIAVQITMALAAAHQEGIIHRDIKPDNVMIRTDGIVKVLDFGLAKTANSMAKPDNKSEYSQKVMTMPGMIMGTPQYMSPEQARGEKIDSRTDIFSLGMVIYEMITSHPPFIGKNSMDTISSILRDPPPPLEEYIENPPSDLERIIHRTLHKKPAKRFQNVSDLLVDLKQLRDVLTIEENRAKDTDEAVIKNTAQSFVLTGFRQSSAFYPFVFLSLISVVSIFLWWYVKDLPNNRQNDSLRSSFETVEILNYKSASGDLSSSASFSPDGETVAFDSTESNTQSIWIKRTNSGDPVQVTKDEFYNKYPVWSPDGKEIAFYSIRDDVAGIWRVTDLGGSPKSIAQIKDFGAQLKLWSKSGKIYYQSRGNLFAVDAATGKTTQITSFDPEKMPMVTIFSISSDESQVAYIFRKDNKWNIHVKPINGETDSQVVSTPNVINSLIWHPDGKRLLYCELINDFYQIFETDLAGSEPVQLSFAEKYSHILDISADGTRILVGSATENSDLWKVDVENGEESVVSDEITSEFWAEVSPDNDAIVFQSIKNLSQGNKLYKGAIITKPISEKSKTFQLAESGFLPQWSPDGKTIAFLKYIDQQIQIWKIDRTGNEPKRLSADGVTSVGFSLSPYNRFETKYISWSPKSDVIAYSVLKENLSNLWLTSAVRPENTNLTENEDKNWSFNCPVWNSDGSKIAYTAFSMKRNSKGQRTYQFWFYDFKDKKKKKVFETLERTRLLGWLPNEEGLILANSKLKLEPLSPEVNIFHVSVKTGEKRLISILKDAYFYNIHLSSDKKTIGFVSHSENIDNIWITPTLGGKMRRLSNHNNPRVYFSSLSWSPDGKFIVFGKQWRFSFLSMITKLKEEKNEKEND